MTDADLIERARNELAVIQAQIDEADEQTTAARNVRVAIWRKYLALGVPKGKLAELSGVSHAALNDALRIRGEG